LVFLGVLGLGFGVSGFQGFARGNPYTERTKAISMVLSNLLEDNTKP